MFFLSIVFCQRLLDGCYLDLNYMKSLGKHDIKRYDAITANLFRYEQTLNSTNMSLLNLRALLNAVRYGTKKHHSSEHSTETTNCLGILAL